MAAHDRILEATARQGFLAPATIAAAFALQERMLIIAIMRLGGELHIPGLAEAMDHGEAGYELEAEIAGDGTYTVRTVQKVGAE